MDVVGALADRSLLMTPLLLANSRWVVRSHPISTVANLQILVKTTFQTPRMRLAMVGLARATWDRQLTAWAVARQRSLVALLKPFV